MKVLRLQIIKENIQRIKERKMLNWQFWRPRVLLLTATSAAGLPNSFNVPKRELLIKLHFNFYQSFFLAVLIFFVRTIYEKKKKGIKIKVYFTNKYYAEFLIKLEKGDKRKFYENKSVISCKLKLSSYMRFQM